MSTGMPDLRGLRRQSGAAILVMLLLIIVTAATLLLDRLNTGIRQSIYNPATSIALNEVKESLLSWAVNHPLNPGTLPFPDRRETTNPNYDGYSDCTSGAIDETYLLGRLPWRGGNAPCASPWTALGSNVVDSAGEHLWYAVSKNLVYESPEYPFISPGLLQKAGEDAGWITVRDLNGGVISERVAFVVIAPGPAMAGYSDCQGLDYAGQDRSGTAPVIGNYLDTVTINGNTYSNADYDQDFIMYPNSIVTNGNTAQEQCDQFNDQLVFVTIDELMVAVSKRVLNEISNAITAYYNTNNALPWLAPFTDPKSDFRVFRGKVTSDGNDLIDSSVDFTKWGITPNVDVVWNLTDGSRGIITDVSSSKLTISAGLKLGSDNTFTTGDKYYVALRDLDTKLYGTATANTDGNGLTLEDANKDFAELGVKVGDAIDNISDGTKGIITNVTANRITVGSLMGSGTNPNPKQFAVGDSYSIGSNLTQRTSATSGSNGLTLQNTGVNFTTMGVQTGDMVKNVTDNSYGIVTTVGTNSLTVGGLYDGTSNAFTVGNSYTIINQRYSPKSTKRDGLLPIYFTGGPYTSAFAPAWNFASGSIVTNIPATGLDTVYTNAMATIIKNSTKYPGSINVAQNRSSCLWISKSVIDCRGSFTADLTAIFNGVTTGTASGNWIIDSGEDFPAKGVKRGDKITNLTSSTQGIIRCTSDPILLPYPLTGCTSGATPDDRLRVSNISGFPNYTTTTGHSYQISVATATITGTPSSPTAEGIYRMYDTGVDFSDIQVGDVIENLRWNSIGIITAVNATANPRYVNFTPLTDGSPTAYPDFVTTEQYRIHYNFVNSREYNFNLRISGNSREYPVNEQRTRDVCVGYGAACASTANNAAFSGDNDTATVAITDYDSSSQLVATTNLVLPVSGASGTLKISGLEYPLLDVDNSDVPEWFIRNKWYQYVLVAYDDGDAPGGTVCNSAISNCITVNIKNAANNTIAVRDDVRAIVMISGNELSGQSWVNATAADYFDKNENTDGNEIFEKHPASNTYNDLMRVATSCPMDATKLCWSN